MTAAVSTGREMYSAQAHTTRNCSRRDDAFVRSLQRLEVASSRRIGVWVSPLHHRATPRHLAYRPHERFAMCSTHKVLTVAALLHRETALDEVVHYTADDRIEYSPVTEQHLATGMTVRELCAASIQVSDNTAANLLMRRIGGPRTVSRYLRRHAGDHVTRLDDDEPTVNDYSPGGVRNTTTPEAIARTYGRLTTSSLLPPRRSALLRHWMRTCETGLDQIRAAAPSWTVGDKTGSGAYGTTNDVAVMWPRHGAPIAIAVLTRGTSTAAAHDTDVVREAARIALRHAV